MRDLERRKLPGWKDAGLTPKVARKIMSASRPKADIGDGGCDVGFGPEAVVLSVTCNFSEFFAALAHGTRSNQRTVRYFTDGPSNDRVGRHVETCRGLRASTLVRVPGGGLSLEDRPIFLAVSKSLQQGCAPVTYRQKSRSSGTGRSYVGTQRVLTTVISGRRGQ